MLAPERRLLSQPRSTPAGPGYHEPLPLAVLDALHRPYLDERGGSALRPEPLAQGLDFATTPVYATTSPLIAHDEGAYIAHDYLIDALPKRRIPDETWCTLIDNVAPAQAFDISTAALDARNYRSAEHGFRHAVAADLPRARLMLASTLYSATRTLEAVDLLEHAFAHDLAELGPDHADLLYARHLHALAVGWLSPLGGAPGCVPLTGDVGAAGRIRTGSSVISPP